MLWTDKTFLNHHRVNNYIYFPASERLGPDLIPRNNYLASNGRRSLVITDLGLTSGYLESFHVYVHPLPEDRRLPRLRLQVWTENQVERGISFTLKWEMTADFTQGPDRRYEVSFLHMECIVYEDSDKIHKNCFLHDWSLYVELHCIEGLWPSSSTFCQHQQFFEWLLLVCVVVSVMKRIASRCCLLFQFPVPPGEFVRLEQNDHVGMTSEGDLNPVTYDFEEHRAVFFRQVTEAGLPLPELGSPLPFDPIPYPAIFSFGVNITQGERKIFPEVCS